MTTTVLFDIDQTLLYSGDASKLGHSGGAGSLGMRRAFQQLYGVADAFGKVEFSGRTDWWILREALRVHGLLDGLDPSTGSGQRGDEGFRRELARFQETYFSELERTLLEVSGGRALPGVPELLPLLAEREGVRMGLATGNFRRAAFIKLRYFGLDAHLTEGGFGDDAEQRSEVVRFAIERVGGADVDARSVWVIGDTGLDIAAAHANGARALGVATGPLSVEELRLAGADVALEDLSETAAVLATLLD